MNKRMKLSAAAIAALMAMTLLVTGCGGTSAPSGSSSAAAQSSAASTESAASEAEAAKSVIDGLDFGGKEMKLCLPFTADAKMQRTIDGFNTKFNAKLAVEMLDWGEYITQMATAMAAGNPYDIIYQHGEFAPMTTKAGVLEPLDGYFTEADLMDPEHPELGGLSPQVMQTFIFEGQNYVAASNRAVYPYLMFYNKLMFRDAGLEDPEELYKAGGWTWDKLVEMGKQVVDPANDTFFLGNLKDTNNWMSINNVSAVEFDADGNPVQNITSEKFTQAMTAYRDLFIGENQISDQQNPWNDEDRFKVGTLYLKNDYITAYELNAQIAKESTAFGQSVENLGVVPFPTVPLNTENGYPCQVAQGWAIGKGTTEPRAAVAYALFESTWQDTATGEFDPPAYVKDLMNSIYNGALYMNISGYKDTDGKNVGALVRDIGNQVREGGDVAASISANVQPLEKIISDTLGK